jgi:hypothetical protein
VEPASGDVFAALVAFLAVGTRGAFPVVLAAGVAAGRDAAAAARLVAVFVGGVFFGVPAACFAADVAPLDADVAPLDADVAPLAGGVVPAALAGSVAFVAFVAFVALLAFVAPVALLTPIILAAWAALAASAADPVVAIVVALGTVPLAARVAVLLAFAIWFAATGDFTGPAERAADLFVFFPRAALLAGVDAGRRVAASAGTARPPA